MHTMMVTIGGLDLELGMNFGAARELSQKVGDPLAIAREAALEAMMTNAGIVHQPKWVPTVENVPMTLWIGAKHGMKDAPKLDAVQEAVFAHGFVEARGIAMDFIAGLVTPTAREKIDGGGEESAGE
jgi:hypothetical protein